ncbi:MAG: lipase [Actinobacteria bacterium]|uniref:Unannotated protein n=1 Tax=freshwater metagenome TaxID=449393 RepID=A0A6J6QQS2_9ZZZZ|nr:lipase [Actinomycetota bacterium]
MHDVPIGPELLRGALDLERTAEGWLPHRLPAWARAQCDDPQLAMVEAQPSGVRLALRTRADVVELVTRPTKRIYLGAPPRPDGVYDLVVDGSLVAQASASEGRAITIDLAAGTMEQVDGPTSTVRFADLGDDEKVLEIWLPHDETTELISLRASAPVDAAPETARPVWLHHGSSISHGSGAAHPTATWPVVAATAGGVDLVNLGFGGSALLDPFVARTMRDLPADLLSIKIGINLVNTDLLRRRAFAPAVHGFLDTLRDGHPDTPLLVVSPILCPIHEQTPGPSAPDFSRMAEGRIGFRATGDPGDATRLTLATIRHELAAVVRQRTPGDPHLRYVDGRELYGEADHAELPLPDDLHPDAATHLRMGARFARLVWGLG